MKIIQKSALFLSTLLLLCGQSFAAQQSAVYVASNKADANTVVAYTMQQGTYKLLGEYKTGGKGTGDLEIPALKKDDTHPLANGDDPLISAFGLVETTDKKHLLVVNPGDASVSLLKVNSDGSLKALSTAKTTNKFPNSIATYGKHVVVAAVGNTNAEGGIEAYTIEGEKLVPVAGSQRDLKARPSTIKFSSNGQFVIVNELVTGKINSFALEGNSLSATPVSTVDSPRAADRFQAIPVGFDIHSTRKGDIIVMSEARFLTPDFKLREQANQVPQSPKYSWQTGSLSTYMLDKHGKLSLVSADVLTGGSYESGEIANCWVEISADGKTIWAANALSGSISTFDLDKKGNATLKNVTAYKDSAELLFFSDLELDDSGKHLFQLVGNAGQVMIFNVDSNGDLTVKQSLDGLPKLGSYGLIVL